MYERRAEQSIEIRGSIRTKVRDLRSWVSRTALADPGTAALAMDWSRSRYRPLLSLLQPIRFPKGRSVTKTSTIASRIGMFVLSHWRISLRPSREL